MSTLALAERTTSATGWRRWLATIGINVGPSKAEQETADLLSRVRNPLGGTFVAAVCTVKGGVGKTTNAICVAQAFAESTGHRVALICANPESGNALERAVPLTTQSLLDHPHAIDLYEAEIAARASNNFGMYEAPRINTFLGLAGRLRVLGSRQMEDDDPTDKDEDSGLTADQLRVNIEVLSRIYDIIIVDCGTSTSTAVFKATMRRADAMVLVAPPRIDALTRGEITLDKVEKRYPQLVKNAIVSMPFLANTKASRIDLEQAVSYYRQRCRAVFKVPFDPALDPGGLITWDGIGDDTRLAALRAAAALGDLFPYKQPLRAADKD